MGQIRIVFEGSFDYSMRNAEFSAQRHGHAAAVEAAVSFLRDETLPLAIKQDVKLAAAGDYPTEGFGPTAKEACMKQAKGETPPCK